MKRARVLIVEDEGVIALDVEHHLRAFGHEVVGIVSSGARAIARAEELQPDLILMDVVIKGDIDGIETARRIRAERDIPVIFLTAFSDEETIARAGESVGHGYLLKPFRPDELRATIGMVLGKHEMECRLRESEARFRGAFDHSAIGMALATRDGTLIQANASCGVILGQDPAALGNASAIALSHPDDAADLVSRLETLQRKDARPLHVEHRFLRTNGDVVWTQLSLSPVADKPAGRRDVILQIQDISDRKRAEEKLAYLAHHDALTGLPNRSHLVDWLDSALVTTARRGQQLGVVFMDLDGFKLVNDTLGHRAGDLVLEIVAARLRAQVRASDFVARLGGDEFVLELPDVESPQDVGRVIEKVIEAIAEPIVHDGHELGISASAGISLYPSDGTTAQRLLVNADNAMYRAKDLGKNTYQFYTADMTAQSVNRLTMERDLRRALAQNEFTLHYQPIVRAGQDVICLEALLRWNSPVHGLCEPAQFMGVAEETGLVIPIGEWVLRTACHQAREWRRILGARVRIAVNLSARQFLAPTLPDIIRRTLVESRLPADALDLEITESSMMLDVDRTASVLRELHEMGVRLWVDDFGTGYSSLGYLKRFPLHGLKIDRTFIATATVDSDDAAVIQAIIAMARSMKLEVIGEGVETEGQFAFLARQGCTLSQGFLFCEPLEATDVVSRVLAVENGDRPPDSLAKA